MTSEIADRRRRTLRWMLPAATWVVVAALLVAGPIAFGVLASNEDSSAAAHHLILGLGVLLAVGVTSVIVCWTVQLIGTRRRDNLCTALAALALAACGTIVAVFMLELVGAIG